MSSKKWIQKLFGAAADQALISLANLGISFAFIKFGSKAEFGLFVIIMAPIYLAQGLQNAFFLSPYVTNLNSLNDEDKRVNLSFLVFGQLIFFVLIGMSAFGAMYAYAILTPGSLKISDMACVVFGVFGVLTREGLRAYQYANSNVGGALRSNLLYSLALFSYLVYSIYLNSISFVEVFFIMGLGGLLPLMGHKFPVLSSGALLHIAPKYWVLARWALVGVLLTWFNSNFYPFALAQQFGLEIVGEVNAARLFWMPLVLVLPAWANLFRPVISRLLQNDSGLEVRLLMYKSVVGGLAILLLFSLSIYLAFPFVGLILGPSYSNLGFLVVAWFAYFLFFFLRNLYQAVLLTDQDGYKFLSGVSIFLFFLLWPLLYVGGHFGAMGVVLSLACLELIQSVLVVYRSRVYFSKKPDVL